MNITGFVSMAGNRARVDTGAEVSPRTLSVMFKAVVIIRMCHQRLRRKYSYEKH